MQRSKVLRPLTEIVAVSVLLTSYIWVWEGTFEGAFTLCIIIYAAIGLAAHLRTGEGPFDIGIRLDNLGSAARDALLATTVIGLLLVGSGLFLGSLDFPPLRLWPGNLQHGIAWGTVQQYGLLCIYYRRFREILPTERLAPQWATGAVFALLHLPNPFLILATFGAGVLSCWLYRRSPNLLVLGIMHGVVSFLIAGCLSNGIIMGMRIGPGYYHYVPRW